MKTSAEEEVKEEVESGVGQKPLLSEELNKSTHTETLPKLSARENVRVRNLCIKFILRNESRRLEGTEREVFWCKNGKMNKCMKLRKRGVELVQ